MMKKLVNFIAFLFLFSSLFAKDTNLPNADKAELFNPQYVPTSMVLRTFDNTLWSVFSSSYMGFPEFWVAYSKDEGKTWSKGFYTGVPIIPVTNYKIYIEDYNFYFYLNGKKPKLTYEPYQRASVDTTINEYILPLSTLYLDSDADGLPNLTEDFLWTDWQNADSDGDGKVDGFDRNPLAAVPDSLSLAEKLHQYIINKELYYFWSNQLVIVEKFSRYMEYEREAGYTLNLSTEECDAWVEAFGYGVPILTCTVKPRYESSFNVSFQFFFAPDDATGYEAIYDWDDTDKRWKLNTLVEEWVAEPEK